MPGVSGTMFFVATANFDVNSTGEQSGKIVFSEQDVLINGGNNPLSNAIFALVASGAELEVEDGNDSAAVSKELFNAASKLINHLGLIGTATMNSSNQVVGQPTYGLNAVDAHTITFITYSK